MTAFHRLTADMADDLAESTGGPAASRALAGAQLSKHLLLIADLLRRWPGPAGERDRIALALQAARTADPEAAARVLGEPMVGAWVAIAARAVARGCAGQADLTHLGAVAAVACAAAGVGAELEVPIRDGAVALPGLGLLTTGGDGTAVVTAERGALTVDAGHGPVVVPAGPGDGDGWQPVRKLRAASGAARVEVALDDVDPYRHGYHVPPAPRLPGEEFARWQELFAEAWRLLVTRIPYRAAEIAAGLRALVPLLRSDARSASSATIRHAFGVFGLTRPDTAADFAVTLVHEYQHVKLSATLDLVDLTPPGGAAAERRYFAPWRTDARPLAGLLQGVYAFAGVADTWRALRGVDGMAETAEREFADARLRLDHTLATVQSSGALTPAGERFAGRLRGFVDTLLSEPVPEAVTLGAERRLMEIHQRWLATNSA